jgi:hypothetical protein
MKTNRLGEVNYNSYKLEMVIEAYEGATDMWVRFTESGHLIHTDYQSFKRGVVKNPYHKVVYGVGFIGEGKYKSGANGRNTKQYDLWRAMLQRCYSEKYQKKGQTYKGVTVCDEWHNFQNYSKWYEENYYSIENKIMCIDKDLLQKGNKIYSPDTCVFVPQFINTLFVKRNKLRGDLPIGVNKNRNKKSKKYSAQCNNNKGDSVYLGSYNTPEEAFFAYKTYKEQLIKDVANEYKNQIPHKLYEAMVNYVVNITD